MIVLDTNVLSELMRPAPNGRVRSWIAAQAPLSLYVTSVTQAEILYGVLLLPAGRRRTSISEAAAAMFQTEFADRVLPFATEAAIAYAQIAAERRRLGRPMSHFDAQIASIARVVGATVATRNVGDFDDCGVDILNPWGK